MKTNNDMLLINNNAGFGVRNHNLSETILFCLDEHDDESIMESSLVLFKQYLYNLKVYFKNTIVSYNNAIYDYNLIKDIEFKDFDAKSEILDRWNEEKLIEAYTHIHIEDIGNLAMLKVFDRGTYDIFMFFMDEHFPRTKQEILNKGRGIRKGVSIFENYENRITSIVYPKFSKCLDLNRCPGDSYE